MKNYTYLTDQEIIRLYREGETDAMGVLVSRYKKGIFSAIVLFVKDSHLAEDLFQDTFIKIINTIKKGGYADEGKFLPWAMRIAHNLCIDHVRKMKTRNKTISSFDSYKEDICTTFENAESNLIKRADHHQIAELIEQLPEEQREVLVLRHYAELSFREISLMTNCSINTALGRMRYALINLRRMMAEGLELAA